MPARALLLVLTCLLAAACGGSSASPSLSTSPSTGPSVSLSASPNESGPTVDEEFCGTIADLESALQMFETIKVKPGNASKLKDAAAGVKAALTPITDTATTKLLNLVDALGIAVDGLSSATENYATASNSGKAAAAKNLKKKVATLHTAINRLRQAAACST